MTGWELLARTDQLRLDELWSGMPPAATGKPPGERASLDDDVIGVLFQHGGLGLDIPGGSGRQRD